MIQSVLKNTELKIKVSCSDCKADLYDYIADQPGRSAEQVAKTVRFNAYEIDLAISRHECEARSSGSCCLGYAGDAAENSFRILTGHHPRCLKIRRGTEAWFDPVTFGEQLKDMAMEICTRLHWIDPVHAGFLKTTTEEICRELGITYHPESLSRSLNGVSTEVHRLQVLNGQAGDVIRSICKELDVELDKFSLIETLHSIQRKIREQQILADPTVWPEIGGSKIKIEMPEDPADG
jgi:hypothetical protein